MDRRLEQSARARAEFQYHPDKNSAPEAESMFKEIGYVPKFPHHKLLRCVLMLMDSAAYQILSDPDKRAFYDKVGKNGMNKVGGEEEVDPREIFSKLFGGEAFYDYVSCRRLHVF